MVQIKKKAKYQLWESFTFAFRGISKAIKRERNIKIHLGAGSLAIILGLLLKISAVEWIVLLFLIASIISAEIMNAAVESVCNLLRFKLDLAYLETYWIRNFAAGAVMVLALAAVVIGLLIFGPKLWLLL